MCVGYPVQLLDIIDGALPTGHVAYGDSTISCCLAYVPEAKVGDYVIVQQGFAVDILDQAAAADSLAAFAELGVSTLGSAAPSPAAG